MEKEKKTHGRPPRYTKEIDLKICAAIAAGRSLNSVCKEIGISFQAVHGWLMDERYKNFLDRYTLAREIQLEFMEDQINDIADESTNDYMEIQTKNGDVREVVNNEAINRSRLRVDTRRWILERMQHYRTHFRKQPEGTNTMQLNIITANPEQAKLLISLQNKKLTSDKENEELDKINSSPEPD